MPDLYIGEYESAQKEQYSNYAEDTVEESYTLYYIAGAVGIFVVLKVLGMI